MNALIIYDSAYGNTEIIAKSLAKAFKPPDKATVALVDAAKNQKLIAYDLVVIGSPTQGGRPTKNIQEYLDSIPTKSLLQKKVAAFDTRFAINRHGLGLKLLMKTLGFASPRIAKSLEAKGGQLVSGPEGFIVSDKEGPLEKGEAVRAVTWMRTILHKNSVRAI